MTLYQNSEERHLFTLMGVRFCAEHGTARMPRPPTHLPGPPPPALLPGPQFPLASVSDRPNPGMLTNGPSCNARSSSGHNLRATGRNPPHVMLQLFSHLQSSSPPERVQNK